MEQERTALTALADQLEERGISIFGIREWPSGLVLSVAANLSVRWADGDYHWHRGRESCAHPDTDPAGAADEIADLHKRLTGPHFTL